MGSFTLIFTRSVNTLELAMSLSRVDCRINRVNTSFTQLIKLCYKYTPHLWSIHGDSIHSKHSWKIAIMRRRSPWHLIVLVRLSEAWDWALCDSSILRLSLTWMANLVGVALNLSVQDPFSQHSKVWSSRASVWQSSNPVPGWCFCDSKLCQYTAVLPLFNEWLDVLPPDLAKSRSREIAC